MTHSSFVGKRTAPSPSSPARSTRKSAKPLSSSRGFGHACRATVAFEACPRPRGSGSSATTSTPCAASERATASPVIWQLNTSARGRALDAGKSDGEGGLALARDAQRERAHPADREPGFVRREVATIEDRPIAHRLRDRARAADRAAHHVAVPVQVLRERVDDDVGAESGGTYQQ